jgi:hypothetical protein
MEYPRERVFLTRGDWDTGKYPKNFFASDFFFSTELVFVESIELDLFCLRFDSICALGLINTIFGE